MSTPDPVRAALAELEDAITLEGFGCACTPHATWFAWMVAVRVPKDRA